MSGIRPLEFGPLLKRRRKAFDFSQATVAGLSGLDEQAISAIELGKRAPTLSEFSNLGRALAFDAAAVLREPDVALSHPAQQVGRFKAGQGSRLDPLDVRLFARAAELSRIGAFLWGQLRDGQPRVTELRQVKAVRARDHQYGREGYNLGKAARYSLAPTPRAPLPSVQAAFESWGVHVAFVPLATKGVVAISLFEPGALPMILLNQHHQRVRRPLSRRSVLAHELCHHLHDGSRKSDLLTLISRSEQDPVEQRANGFAPSFLAPGEWIGRPTGSPRKIVEQVAQDWGFTWSGAAWHAKNLRLFQGRVAEEVQPPVDFVENATLESSVVREAVEAIALEESPSPLALGLIGDLAVQAAARNLISAGRAREILRFQ